MTERFGVVRHIRDWLWITRAEASGIGALGAATGYRMADVVASLQDVSITCVAVFMAFAGGFALHETHDVQVDSRNSPSRPLVRGGVSPREVRRAALTMGGAGLVLASTRSAVAATAVALIFVVLSGYSVIVKPRPVLKNLVMAVLAMVPLCIAGLEHGGFERVVPALGLGILLILIREFVLDLRDVDGDKLEGIKTLANCLPGRTATATASIASFGWGAATAAFGPRIVPHLPTAFGIAAGLLAVAAGAVVLLGRPSYAMYTWVTQILYGSGLAVFIGVWADPR